MALSATFMEVCGTHTTSIYKHGIRSLLPEAISLRSGPGCPVCVTPQGEIDAVMKLAQSPKNIIATFGDLLRVPGKNGSLLEMRAKGADIRMVYSSEDALALASANPDREVVFIGIGFETTAPASALTLLQAKKEKVKNFSILSLHKRTPPALDAVMLGAEDRIQGLILPGHVSVIIGEKGFQEIVNARNIPAVITGFEPVDILGATLLLTQMVKEKRPELVNLYGRAVRSEGNPKALAMLTEAFDTTPSTWRGIGEIPASGLSLKPTLEAFDAIKKFDITIEPTETPKGCRCGDILTASLEPKACPLFGTTCTPAHPVGPCMVSTDGSCAAAAKYD